ncbi:hypothetical protein N7G274_004336 [Stereocaulon virgatum]|uniref:Uncharacterized protein n=1 Tax=Stereocaulon virgatum TaxID=373712 RepID=A0ABR4A9L4_9LECA
MQQPESIGNDFSSFISLLLRKGPSKPVELNLANDSTLFRGSEHGELSPAVAPDHPFRRLQQRLFAIQWLVWEPVIEIFDGRQEVGLCNSRVLVPKAELTATGMNQGTSNGKV